MKNIFFPVFFATIVIARLVVFIYPNTLPTISGLQIHHYMIGVLLILVGIFGRSLVLYTIGLGLFIDQLAFIIIGGKTPDDYFSMVSMLGTLGFVIVILLCQDCFTRPVLLRED